MGQELDNRIYFEEQFKLNLFRLYKKLDQFCKKRKELLEAYDYYGGYDILLEAQELISNKIEAGSIQSVSNLDGLILTVSVNILKNKAAKINRNKPKNAKYLHLDDLNFDESITVQPLISITDIHKSEDYFSNITGTVSKMYSSLWLGEIDRCQELTKYIKKIIDKQTDLELKKFSTAILLLFRSELFFDQGRLDTSYKYIKEAIKIFDLYSKKYGYQYLCKANNLQAMILLNQGHFKEGFKIFEKNNLILGSTKDSDYGIDQLKKESDRYEFMFSFNTKYKSLRHLKNVILDTVNIDDLIADGYATAYLYIDAGDSEKGIDELNKIKKIIHVEASPLDIVRHYTALAEAMTCNFEVTSKDDIIEIFKYVNIIKSNNAIIKSIFFASMIKILEGFAIGDKYLFISGLESLKRYQYYHYSDWYRKKLEKFLKKE